MAIESKGLCQAHYNPDLPFFLAFRSFSSIHEDQVTMASVKSAWCEEYLNALVRDNRAPDPVHISGTTLHVDGKCLDSSQFPRR